MYICVYIFVLYICVCICVYICINICVYIKPARIFTFAPDRLGIDCISPFPIDAGGGGGGASGTNCMTHGVLSDILQNFSRNTHHPHFY